ncbi:hypothetical protein NE237_032374 [Protea cynaroides]|uniref:Uncharacterized protein n=1 Tax=Protea cynaroides TaxID=273540 RepID=A0A9Q0R3E5_9MAGN|nr:hypothetical protein NE237_032374 [Protea cynaroides]
MIIEGLSQVTLHVSASLHYFLTIQSRLGQEQRVSIKYELLPVHYFFCSYLGHDLNRYSRCFEADQSHRVVYGCDPLLQCPLLPPRELESKIRGVIPTLRMLETAKFVDLSLLDSGGTSPVPVSIAYLNSWSSGGPPLIPLVSLPLTVPSNDSHLASLHSFLHPDPYERMSLARPDTFKSRYAPSVPFPSLTTVWPLLVLPPLFIDQYFILFTTFKTQPSQMLSFNCYLNSLASLYSLIPILLLLLPQSCLLQPFPRLACPLSPLWLFKQFRSLLQIWMQGTL